MLTILTNVAVGSINPIESIDFGSFSPAVQEYVVRIGLKNILQDAHAAVTEKTNPDEKDRLAVKTAASMKKLDAMVRGEVASIRTNSIDQVSRIMRELAEVDVKAKLPASIKWGKLDRKIQQQVIDKQVAANEASYRKAAEARLAIVPESAETPEDIMALLGVASSVPPTE